jgi:hypothetical protein
MSSPLKVTFEADCIRILAVMLAALVFPDIADFIKMHNFEFNHC